MGCVSTTEVNNTEPKPVLGPEKPKVIRIFPDIPMPIQDQIEWSQKLDRMPPSERAKVEQALEDGMFKPIKELERLRMLYPLPRDPREI